ncbi:MAG: hypothetical protein ACD_52C00294G0001 [uncultured bacterium]|uniref:ATPase n=1 Tax=Candidatus Woesebacteria bacterium RIFCSPHIGHO2_12_FULL_41_24 TaxID=1802510 RepID=A0A1F8ATU5_9BACT|nr:MAG: hypothetical protein ACD_52C00294G0001 [uncultured bacterium]OGM14728.1 MAG: ATPase [Candidatus Woesebacteria bacterium RBG_16_41_13]OGM29742.1 MAG: ATPase [Candidatus Woesebacteria bacterium RIFCSPHIGHO2_01_FULL_42_80]OGM35269.1 MAG: ATPase [Candidatus Woesebacteria bacterium RIFCSPHIGHO2_02_FULL_42_20]OGM55164.1 MAG: ATPase [Candidatus Woesebacteria bacterium RIFCSPHIGHO2_12_FULL_41_24]OGM67736.1 MAG: ATPase [Candidatus Woesebacteria bacterium RIFCSPLOWO2_01_FULL_42_67]OGM70705.1 MA
MVIKRYILKQLIEHLRNTEISLITGPRQAGKTTLMLELKKNLDRKGERTLFLSLDREIDKIFFESQVNLIARIESEMGKRRGFVFLDEIQRKENAGIYLKGIFDMNLPYKFIVSGSGSLELKEKIHESLAGRKRVFELKTLSFEEFVNFKTEYKYEDRIINYLSIDTISTQQFLQEYLNYGGYPKVVLAETLNEKFETINEIFQSYLDKDISYLLGIKKSKDFNNLVRLLASQIGNLANLSEISNTLGINVRTVKNYIYYLEKTFTLDEILPFFRNIRSEITKTPTYYFTDLGLRNMATRSFGQIELNQNIGFLFQNFVYRLLTDLPRSVFSRPRYWRTKHGSEIDFIIEKGLESVPVDVKYKQIKKPELTRSMRSFIEKYSPKNAFVVNLFFEETIKIQKTKVHFVPFYKAWAIWQS